MKLFTYEVYFFGDFIKNAEFCGLFDRQENQKIISKYEIFFGFSTRAKQELIKKPPSTPSFSFSSVIVYILSKFLVADLLKIRNVPMEIEKVGSSPFTRFKNRSTLKQRSPSPSLFGFMLYTNIPQTVGIHMLTV